MSAPDSLEGSLSSSIGVSDDEEIVLREVNDLLSDLHTPLTRGVGLDSDLISDLGVDSLGMVELHDRLERAFGTRLSEEVLESAVTPRQWLEAIRTSRGALSPIHAPGHAERPSPSPSTRRVAGAPWPESARTLTEVLAWHSQEHPDLVTIRLLKGEYGEEVEEISYGTLARQAENVALALLSSGSTPGDRVAMMLPTGRAYFEVFLGVLLAGAVPVPIYPPARLAGLEDHLGRQARLLKNAGASLLVTVPEARAVARLVRARVPTLRAVLTAEELTTRSPASLSRVEPADIALIQYTSGSTGDPKGVVLSHEQILANIRAMCGAARVTTADVFVSWLPLYHDMGLIGAWLAPLYIGMPLVIMSPVAFLARPSMWLRAISDCSGTLSAAPNFAYQSCVDRIADSDLDGVDLSSWRIAFNGSEPVRAKTTEQFTSRFGRQGFAAESMCPAYGLAEVGVGIAFSPPGRGPHVDYIRREQLAREKKALPAVLEDGSTLAIVGCGVPLPGYDIEVAGASGDELPERFEGEVWCRGPSATPGYFANDAANAELWREGWMRTGDLGYMADGELFLTGRSKDLVIRAGRNLHPEDIEAELGEIDGAVRGGIAVFSGSDSRAGTERLVVAVETDLEEPKQRAELTRAIELRTNELISASPDEIVLTTVGALPRTASGKVRRSAAREAFEAGHLGKRPPPVSLQLARFAVSGVVPSLRRASATLETWCFAGYVWVIVGLVALPLWLAMLLPLSLRARWALTRAGARSLRTLTRVPLAVEGALPPPGQPAIVVANHASFLDGLVLILLSKDPLVFVTSTDLERNRVFGSFLRRLGCVFVERGNAPASASEVKNLEKVALAGGRLAIFPEGSISKVPALRPFHLGAFAVASATGSPVVPVGIRGTRSLLAPGSFLLHRSQVTLTVGTAIAGAADHDGISLQAELRDRTREEVAKLCKDPLL